MSNRYTVAAHLRFPSPDALRAWLDAPVAATSTWPDWAAMYRGWRFKTRHPAPVAGLPSTRDAVRDCVDASDEAWVAQVDPCGVWLWATVQSDDQNPDRVHRWAERWFSTLGAAAEFADQAQRVHYLASADVDPAALLAVLVLGGGLREFADAGGLAEYGIHWQDDLHAVLDPLQLWRDAAEDAGADAVTDPRFRAEWLA